METATAADLEKENSSSKRKNGNGHGPTRPPSRATTPVNGINHYVPGGSGSRSAAVVTPAVRPGSAMAGGTSNKRPKLGTGDSGGGRTVLGSSNRRNNIPGNRAASPSKVKTPGRSLPRSAQIHMPVPKSGTQRAALGHGKAPSIMSMSTSTSSKNFPGRGVVGAGGKKGRRESFKPRPSVDVDDWQQLTAQGKWGGYGSVKEEDEDDGLKV
jgi:hypothetical protein